MSARTFRGFWLGVAESSKASNTETSKSPIFLLRDRRSDVEKIGAVVESGGRMPKVV